VKPGAQRFPVAALAAKVLPSASAIVDVTQRSCRMAHNTIPQPRRLPLIGNVADLNPHTPVQSMMALARVHGPNLPHPFHPAADAAP
jgi:hypothetical protein